MIQYRDRIYSISIIIVLYNSEKVIFDCLRSITQYTDIDPLEIEIILVDNYPNSDFKNLLASFKEKNIIDIKYIKNFKNGGFGQGNNLGVSHSSGVLLFFLNPDTILTPEFSFRKILEISKSDDNLVLGFRLVDLSGKENNSYSSFPEYSFLSFFYNIIRKKMFLLPNAVNILNRSIWPWGAAFIVNKEKFLKAGQFDEEIFLCNEEPDLMKRLPDRKIKLLAMNIVHLEGHTTTSSSFRYRAYLNSAVYYILKHGFNKFFFIRSVIFRENLKYFITRSAVAKEKVKILREYL
jgi:N-acetylglucosaminyl-diphospho-decaprenol L-rhamnosyltransferase